VLGLKDANSTEMNENTPFPVIDLMEAQKTITEKGGTMRLGAWACELTDNSIVKQVYKTTRIDERHRHRFEYNNAYRDQLEAAGLKTTGINPETNLVEIVEIEEIDEAGEIIDDVPFAVIENVPIYPGCESAGNNAAKKKCMSSKIQKFVQKKFNTDLASDLGLEGIQQIYVQFKIDKTGNITNVQARAPHPKLKQEAIKTIKALPKMTPGKQRGQAVGVLYSLPIRFQIEN